MSSTQGLRLSLAFLLLVGCADSQSAPDPDAGTNPMTDGGGLDSAIPDCVSGTKRCTGLVPEVCSSNGTWVAGAACDFVCATGECLGECVPGATRCTDLVPESCDTTGSWVAGTACDFVCTDGACVGNCVPGTTTCDGLQPQTCNAAGAFENSGAACDYVCTSGTCEGSCVPGTTRCDGLSPQQCDATGTYQPLRADCEFVCADAACTGTCVPGTRRCGATAATVELCDATGTFQPDETCLQDCGGGACVCGPDYSGDGYACAPLDFCEPTRGGCSPNAMCSQTGTTPSCACNVGYVGDGLHCSTPPTTFALLEDFNDISLLSGLGWTLQNSSVAVGSTSWFQGNATTAGGPFDSYNGAANAYIGANYNNTGSVGTISNWLLTPEIDFGDEAMLEFYTRKPSPDNYADRLEVRVCSTLPCDAPGAGSTAGFDSLLLSINPNLTSGVYPTTWTRFQVTNASGIPRSGRGRIAFRYFVTSGGLSGTNSDYIGIDAVRYQVGAPSYPVQVVADVQGAPSGITVELNRQVSMAVMTSGTTSFPTTLSAGTPYVVTVHNVPAATTCVVTNGSGTIQNAAVTVTLTCTTN